MLKQLDEVKQLSETYAYWHTEYKQKLKALLDEMNFRFREHPKLIDMKVTVTDAGQLKIEPNRLYVTHSGMMVAECMTLDCEELFAIVEILREETPHD